MRVPSSLPNDQARSADMPQAEMTACLDLLECAGDALPYTVVVPDDHPFVGHEAECGVGVRDDIVVGVRSVYKNQARAAQMPRPVEGGGVAIGLRDARRGGGKFGARVGEVPARAGLVDIGTLARRETEFGGRLRRQI